MEAIARKQLQSQLGCAQATNISVIKTSRNTYNSILDSLFDLARQGFEAQRLSLLDVLALFDELKLACLAFSILGVQTGIEELGLCYAHSCSLFLSQQLGCPVRSEHFFRCARVGLSSIRGMR